MGKAAGLDLLKFSSDDFPRLTVADYNVTSPATTTYNCIAWSAGDAEHWWQPGICWPIDTARDDCGTESLAQAFRSLGYETCSDGGLEEGIEKVALYGQSIFYTHAARQLLTGKWTSKLGRAEDIEHESPEILAGGIYGEVVAFMSRPLEQ